MKIAIAGLGTVGAGVVKLLQQNAELIAARAGQAVTVAAVSARDKNKKRDCTLPGDVQWIAGPLELVKEDVNVIVELIGGAEGAAHQLADAALKAGKHFVTANKALLAVHGAALAKTAEDNNVQLLFEGAVTGGIPVIKVLRDGLAGNAITCVRGILNGTCNYILTRMRDGKMDFAAALSEAQKLGYAETDPSADIDGHDTAHKLSLLAALAFHGRPDLKAIPTEGIRHITPLDLQFAEELACRIKLLGVARLHKAGLQQYVAPVLVSKNTSLARVNGPTNAVLIHGDFVGDLVLEGVGAGACPTASAVVGDLIDLARGVTASAFGMPVAQLKTMPPAKSGLAARFYMRLQVMDKPGVVADISAILRDATISIESLLQRGKSVTQSVPVVITTHEANIENMRKAASLIAQLPTIVGNPCVLRIED